MKSLVRTWRVSRTSEVAASFWSLGSINESFLFQGMITDVIASPFASCHSEPLFPLSLRAKGVAISVGGIQWHLRNNNRFVVGLISIMSRIHGLCMLEPCPSLIRSMDTKHI